MRGLGAVAVIATLWSGCAYAHFDGVRYQPCDNRPPVTAEQPITVPISVLDVPGADMFVRCHKQQVGNIIYGCTFLPTAGHKAVVVINADMTADEQKCTLTYEKAHLPPNNWFDQATEAATPGIIAWTPPKSMPVSSTTPAVFTPAASR